MRSGDPKTGKSESTGSNVPKEGAEGRAYMIAQRPIRFWKDRAKTLLIGGGVGFHWPDLDEDISVIFM